MPCVVYNHEHTKGVLRACKSPLSVADAVLEKAATDKQSSGGATDATASQAEGACSTVSLALGDSMHIVR